MNIIEIAREAGINACVGKTDKSGKYQPYINALGRDVPIEWLQAFADLHRKTVIAELIAGVGEPAHHIMGDGQCIGYYSAERVAAAVAKSNESAYQRGYLDGKGSDTKRISELEVENDRLSAHMAELRDLHNKRIESLEKNALAYRETALEWQKRVAELEEQNKQLLEALKEVWLWMENQYDGQSKGGHATFDMMMLREHRDIARDAIAAVEVLHD